MSFEPFEVHCSLAFNTTVQGQMSPQYIPRSSSSYKIGSLPHETLAFHCSSSHPYTPTSASVSVNSAAPGPPYKGFCGISYLVKITRDRAGSPVAQAALKLALCSQT